MYYIENTIKQIKLALSIIKAEGLLLYYGMIVDNIIEETLSIKYHHIGSDGFWRFAIESYDYYGNQIIHYKNY